LPDQEAVKSQSLIRVRFANTGEELGMARRGFFAELQHQAEVAARERAKAARKAEQEQNAAIRRAEQARKANERAAAQRVRAAAAEHTRLEKEARDAHIAAMEAEVERRNSELSETYEAIDSLLAATLDVDDYVDLPALHIVAQHPPFDRTDLEVPVPLPSPIVDPPTPVFTSPMPPKGLHGVFGKKNHEKAVAEASAAHERRVAEWQSRLTQNESAREAAANQYADMESGRVAALEVERARYAAECSAREAAAAEHNEALDTLIANLGYGAVDAVQEYVSLVFSNSAYPAAFPVEHDFEFDAATAELRLRVLVPGPDKVSSTSVYKYTKSSDEITATSLSQKACKERYAGAVHQVALRSMHEVFEADRRGLIKTISLEVGTETIDPATGREGYTPFVATGAERDSFLELDLANVVPAATLSHLGAVVYKNPYDLVHTDASGIRRA
jgi:restriction system protein